MQDADAPRATHHRCVAGEVCNISGLSGPAAYGPSPGLVDGHSLLIGSKCGQGMLGWPERGVSDAGVAATYTWSGSKVTAPGGLYRLCWCPQNPHPAAKERD